MWQQFLGGLALVAAMIVQVGCGGPPEGRRGPVPEEKLLPGPNEAPGDKREIIEEWKLKVLSAPDLAADGQSEQRVYWEGACTLALEFSDSSSVLPSRK